MTGTKIFGATVAVWLIVLGAAGATFYGARPDAVRPEIEDDSSEPLKKGDRLPWSAPGPLATAAQLEVTPPVASLLPEQLPLATAGSKGRCTDVRRPEKGKLGNRTSFAPETT
jgi:hypothetical protein